MVSGALQEWLGYQHFFVFAIVASLVPMILAWNARFPVSDAEDLPV